MRKLLCVTLLLLCLLLTACLPFREGITMPHVCVGVAYENETYLVIDDLLICKTDGTVRRLQGRLETGAYEGLLPYRYVLLQDSVEQYAFSPTYSGGSSIPYYTECVVEYGYDGTVLRRTEGKELLSRADMEAAYQAALPDPSAYTYAVLGGSGSIYRGLQTLKTEELGERERALLASVESRYGEQAEYDGPLTGLIRIDGDGLRLSVSGSNRRDSLRAEPLISGIDRSEILAYDADTGECRSFFLYDGGAHQIIDFDALGAYVLSSRGTLGYVDFETDTETEIASFRDGGIDRITVTDRYILVEYQHLGRSCFVYEKGGSVIASTPISG